MKSTAYPIAVVYIQHAHALKLFPETKNDILYVENCTYGNNVLRVITLQRWDHVEIPLHMVASWHGKDFHIVGPV